MMAVPRTARTARLMPGIVPQSKELVGAKTYPTSSFSGMIRFGGGCSSRQLLIARLDRLEQWRGRLAVLLQARLVGRRATFQYDLIVVEARIEAGVSGWGQG